MKPLVLWCRWHDARLRLHGRDEQAVWGELIFADRAARADRGVPFRYELQTRRLTIGGDEEATTVLLDEMGVERPG